MDDPRKQLLDDSPPKPVRSGPNRAVMTIAAAVILGILMLVVVFNLDSQRDAGIDDDFDDLRELVAPRQLTDQDRSRGDIDFQRGFQAELARGGWVQIADRETGQLQQQYRCERLDPNPEGLGAGWLRLDRPEMEIYLTGDRVVTLTGQTAYAYAPHRGIEMGTITDEVILRLFEAGADGQIDLDRDEPALVVRTDEASFDHFLGEIRCDDWVDIKTPRLQMPGRQLNLLVSDQDNTIQLRVESYDYIRLLDEQAQTQRAVARHRDNFSSRPVRWFVNESHAVRSELAGSRRIVPANLVSAETRRRDDAATFYLLTARENIRIDQGDAAVRKEAHGDQLRMVFSAESEGLDRGHAGRSTEPKARGRFAAHNHPLTMDDRVESDRTIGPPGERLPRGEVDSSMLESLLGEGITIVRGDGPLTIVPLDDPALRPDESRDAWFELMGRPVTFVDRESESEAVGRSMRYTTVSRRIEMEGTSEHPMHVVSPDLEAGGERFVLHQTENRGGFEGAGWLVRREAGSGFGRGAVRVSSEDNGPADNGPRSEPSPELQVTWEEGMDLVFEDPETETDRETRGGRLREAVFRGRVRVSTDEFLLNAEEMTVGFPTGAEEMNQIESIHARNRVRVLGVGTQGAIRCEDLTLDLTVTPDGRSVPTLMVATGDVEAIDDDQIIWADSLRVTFRTDEVAAPTSEQSDDGDSLFGREGLQVDQLIARENVQVLLADGTRAYAELLEGDGREEQVELSGGNVAIVSDKMIMDQGERIILNRRTGKASSPGPGQLRLYRDPVTDPRRERTPRPVIDDVVNPMEVRTRWRDSMTYDGRFNEGAGAIDFRGEVDVRAEPDENELNLMTGDSLTLEFLFVDVLPEHVEPGEPVEPAERRELSLMLARGDARLESRAWDDERQRENPRIFYVAGQHVEYRPLRRNALVVGDGELLIHDPHGDEAGRDQTPFGTKGSTMMSWRRQLRLEHRVDQVYDLFASDQVELQHHALDGAISTMTGDQIEAVIVRADRRDGTGEHPETFDFGGGAQIERLRGEGGIILKTDQREIDCDSFDYDVPNALARASARPGRVLAVQTTGVPGVLTAEEVIWNMERDSIRITRAAGTTPR